MKTADVKIGDIYAIVSSAQEGEPFNTTQRARSYGTYRRKRPTKTDVHEGIEAAPARVVAIGKFRKRRVGACDAEIVEDHYMTTVKVEVVDVYRTLGIQRPVRWDTKARLQLPTGDSRIGYSKGLKLNHKKVVWVEDVVNAADIVMPWESFLQRHAERAMAAFEHQALMERLHVVDENIKEISFRLVEHNALMRDPQGDTSKLEMVVEYGDHQTTYTGVRRTTTKLFPLSSDVPVLQPWLSEREELVRRLNCS